jgi:ribosomal-protein-serine acetyltransferase
VSALVLGARSFDTPLETPHLELRSLRRGDLDALDEAIRETLPQLVRWLPWAHPGHQRADTRRYLRAARAARTRAFAFEYVIVERAGGLVVGIASLHRLDWSRLSAGLGYWIRASRQGRGYATEAARALVEYGFAELRLHRIEAHVALENRASQRVPEKLGFTREGVARENEYINGHWLDHIQYSILTSDRIGAREGRR